MSDFYSIVISISVQLQETVTAYVINYLSFYLYFVVVVIVINM